MMIDRRFSPDDTGNSQSEETMCLRGASSSKEKVEDDTYDKTTGRTEC